MKKTATLLFIGLSLIASAAQANFHINAPTKDDIPIHSRDSVWAKEDKNPAISFFAELFGSKSDVQEKVVEAPKPIEPPKPQYVAAVDLTGK